MKNKMVFSEKYLEILEETKCTSINCYTGSLLTLLNKKENLFGEVDIWSVGEGFNFTSSVDEYNVPELGFNMFNIVDTFCSKLDIKLIQKKCKEEERLEVILNHLKNGLDLIIWTNSKYLLYSALYKSSNGYIHAINLHSSSNKNKLILRDNLIFGIPPRACKIEVSHDFISNAISNKVNCKYDYCLNIITYLKETPNIKTSKELIIQSLLKSAKKSIKSGEILKYKESCRTYMESLNNEAKLLFLRRISETISTLYIIPNRLLLLDLLKKIIINDSVFFKQFDNLMIEWKTLSIICLKMSITKSINRLDKMDEKLILIDNMEKEIWEKIKIKIKDINERDTNFMSF